MKYKVTLNGKTYEVEVEAGKAMLVDEYEAYAPAPKKEAASAPAQPASVPQSPAPQGVQNTPEQMANGEVIKSPMPGNILKINVAQGQAVKAGQVLIILEAMKMENEILAPRDGTVAQVVTTKGATVDTGAALLVWA